MFTVKKLFDLDNEYCGVDNFHDCVLLATGDSYTPEELLELFNTLPAEIQGIALSWGLSDTVFRDCVFEYLRENSDE